MLFFNLMFDVIYVYCFPLFKYSYDLNLVIHSSKSLIHSQTKRIDLLNADQKQGAKF
jgi:hypothetical protein